VVVDRATALEQQASGSFDDLERKLATASITPQAVPFTPAQLETLGIRAVAIVDQTELTDADRVDALLVQHCVGEGHDGLLVDTKDACQGAADHTETMLLVDRTNTARLQLWRWMHTQKPDVTVEDLRRAWHVSHARGTVCGAWVESDDGKWAEKSCS
jgi:uncharacterized protein YdbL (DUF1318 family)